MVSIECELKPVTEFLLDTDVIVDDIGTMARRYSTWEFGLAMGYPTLDLVNYPSYFGISLEQRIKPRYAQMKQSDVKLVFRLFISPDSEFEKAMELRMIRESYQE